MQNIEGIEKINDFGQVQEIRISKDSDTQKIIVGNYEPDAGLSF